VETFVAQLDEVARSHNQYAESLTNMVTNSLDAVVKDVQKDLDATEKDAAKVEKAWQVRECKSLIFSRSFVHLLV
jgi:hypothetical protein